MIRRCLKWVKNTYLICGVAQYITDNKDSKFPIDEIFNTALREMGPKSVSLFMRAVFETNVWLTINFHMYRLMCNGLMHYRQKKQHTRPFD